MTVLCVTATQIQRYQKYMMYFVVAHLPLFAAGGVLFHLPLVGPLMLQGLLSVFMVGATYLYPQNKEISLDVSAVCICLTPAVLLYLLSSHSWQLDAHMYFFACLAMTTAFRSLRATLFATVAIALHHLVLNFVIPYAVFPEGENFYRVVFHAVIVIAETSVILLTIHELNQNDERREAESQTTLRALEEAREARLQQENAEERAHGERRQALLEIARNFNMKVGGIISTLIEASLSRLNPVAQSMREVADNVLKNSQNVADASQKAVQDVSKVAASIEELSQANHEISSQVSQVREKASDTAQNASRASEVVSHLHGLTSNIGEVVLSIRKIAEQTNLLALNATIEAARAGELGKGFAVVADEVKKLANETSRKTDDIEGRIQDIQNTATACVDVMEHIIQNIDRINGAILDVCTAMDRQNMTTSDIVKSTDYASKGVRAVGQVIGRVQESAKVSGASSEQVLEVTHEVGHICQMLKEAVSGFLIQLQGHNPQAAEEGLNSKAS